MNEQRKQPEAMLFDLDGTLFKTEILLIPAYHATFEQLRQEGLFSGATPPDERILGCLGMLLEKNWEIVIPGTSAETRNRADVLLLQYQTGRIERRVRRTLSRGVFHVKKAS